MTEPYYDDGSMSITDHILCAERHTQTAKEMCYTVNGFMRPRRTRIALDRAQQILIKLYLKELKDQT